ncbi:uncharacterized protein LOC126982630 [Eriocheir sinensis]|uniref:uncharacterized protein LOC126982630 n=2 Tax=Eriocheir sinensis TaxID=95602 RepID=UPI0021C5E585|nr:uncharacterized protein LOC126982630 [Eriocheir sinensis]XP_050690796.1 uncharacterized protein LOC126982630 [Eriocheir sinensis]
MEEDNSGKEMKLNHKKRKASQEETEGEMEEAPRQSFHPGLSGALPTSGQFCKLPEVFELLRYPGNALESIPPGEKNNVFFIVNNSEHELKTNKGGFNKFHDDCVWERSSGSQISSHVGNFNGLLKAMALYENKFYERNPPMSVLDPQPDKESVVKVRRFYATLKANKDYKRRITVLSGDGFREDRALVEYCGRVMKPTAHERCKKLKKNVLGNPGKTKYRTKCRASRDVYENKFADLKDSHQVHNVEDVASQKVFKKLVSKVPDEKQVILTMLAESPSVQTVINRKDQPQCVILYSEEQLSDMKRNLECDNVLGVDCTYKFGDCFVTMTVYQNLRALHKDTNEPLLFLGPVYLHWDKEFLTYVSFFSHIMDKLDGIEPNIEVKLGNDVGLPLFKALKCSFPTSSHILDCHHLKTTVNRELYDVCDGKVKESSIISKKMFGLEGLTSSPTLFLFRKRLSDLAPYFEEFPRLRNYFIKMGAILYEYCCEPQQKGVFPKLWVGCRDEVLSSHIQSVLCLESYELPVLVKEICTISNLQMQHIEDRCE